MNKRLLRPDTTFYPAAVVLITTGGSNPNVMTCNRVASCSAEPPRISISIRPSRHSHALIQQSGEFVVNLPARRHAALADYVGVVSGREEDKLAVAGLRLAPAQTLETPLLADLPVNIECSLEHTVELDSHSLFIGLVQAVHAQVDLLDDQGEIDLEQAGGLSYGWSVVRERPTYSFRVEDLRRAVSQASQGGPAQSD